MYHRRSKNVSVMVYGLMLNGGITVEVELMNLPDQQH